MIEYLYKLLKDVDRLNVTQKELKSYINRNSVIIEHLKRDSRYNRQKNTYSTQKAGGHLDNIDNIDNIDNTNNTNNTHNKKYIKLIGGGVEELDDLVQQSKSVIDETDAQIAKTESNLKEYEESKDKIEETIEIAKLSTEFLNDVSKIVNNKNKEEYETLGKQLADITNILNQYTKA